MTTRKLKIYLADLNHDRHMYNYCVPLNVGYIAATANKRLGKAIETQIYKFPDDLISAMKSSQPDVLALSNYDWNVNLNIALIKIARELNPEVFVMMGGPNIRKTPEGIKDYLVNHPTDMCILNEGEDAFSTIIEYVLDFWPCNIKNLISSSEVSFQNAAYLQKDTQDLIQGGKPDSALAKDIPFPSPWLAGLMDPFINNTSFPLQAMVETNRNCPYQCSFCVYGDFDLNQLRVFELDTVLEEIRYIFKRTKFNFSIWFADANFGILDRDILIAEELRRLADKYKNVGGLYIAQAKNNIKRNLEIAKILGKICVPEYAVQTLTPGVLEYSGRKNPKNDAIKEYVAGIKESGNEVYTDILLGLPGESKQEFLDSMKKVIDFGFDTASVADIRLLDGSVMGEDDYRESFGLESRFRVIPSAYGEYNGIKVVEYEECIRKTNTMSTEDFIELRLFNANYFLLYFIELGRPILNFIQEHGLHPITLISDISKPVDKVKFPILSEYITKFNKTANEEWFDSVDAAQQHYLQPKVFKKIMQDGFPKLNYQYAAHLVADTNLRNEFMGWMGENIKNKLANQTHAVDELLNFCAQRVYSLPYDSKEETMELSSGSANHLVEYIDDYNNNSDEADKIYRVKGEVRDVVGSINSVMDKTENLEPFVEHSNKNTTITLKFDTNKEKAKWLSKEIERNGGADNISLAIQTVLNQNHKAFLRSWSLVNS